MLKLKDNVDFKALEKYGFHSYKVNRNQTNWYRCFANGANLILLTPLRNLYIEDWKGDDNRIHKQPKCYYKNQTTVYDCLFELIRDGLIEMEIKK